MECHSYPCSRHPRVILTQFLMPYQSMSNNDILQVLLTHWPQRDVPVIFKAKFSISLHSIKSSLGTHTYCQIALRLMAQNLTDHDSTLVQVMAWFHQAASHYLNQCWLRSLSPYSVARPQWLKRTFVVIFPRLLIMLAFESENEVLSVS